MLDVGAADADAARAEGEREKGMGTDDRANVKSWVLGCWQIIPSTNRFSMTFD